MIHASLFDYAESDNNYSHYYSHSLLVHRSY
jgi:hypothetical protein